MKVYYGKDRSKIMLVSSDETEVIFVDSRTDEEVRMSKEDYDLIRQAFRSDVFKIDLSKAYTVRSSSTPWTSFPTSPIIAGIDMTEPVNLKNDYI